MDRYNRKIVITELHKNSIISAAEKLISEKGYEKTTIDDISKYAEYSKRTIYSYFDSKDEIYYEIILKSITLLKKHLQKALSNTNNLIAGYKAICRELINFYNEFPQYFKGILKFQNAPNDFNETDTVVYKIYLVGEEINALIIDFIIMGQNQGLISKEIEPKKTVFILWSSLSGLISIAYTKSVYIEKEMEISIDAFLDYGFNLFFKLLSAESEQKNY